jgi:hypothetical protein
MKFAFFATNKSDLPVSGSLAAIFTRPAYDRYVELYRQVVQRRKGDAHIDPKLHGLRKGCQIAICTVSLVHPFLATW